MKNEFKIGFLNFLIISGLMIITIGFVYFITSLFKGRINIGFVIIIFGLLLILIASIYRKLLKIQEEKKLLLQIDKIDKVTSLKNEEEVIKKQIISKYSYNNNLFFWEHCTDYLYMSIYGIFSLFLLTIISILPFAIISVFCFPIAIIFVFIYQIGVMFMTIQTIIYLHIYFSKKCLYFYKYRKIIYNELLKMKMVSNGKPKKGLFSHIQFYDKSYKFKYKGKVGYIQRKDNFRMNSNPYVRIVVPKSQIKYFNEELYTYFNLKSPMKKNKIRKMKGKKSIGSGPDRRTHRRGWKW